MCRYILILALLFTLACSNSNTSSTPANNSPAYFSQSGAGPTQQDGRIRGNRKSMIYHWPGCSNYDDIAPSNRVYFKTRAEAEAAGYRAARNCS